MRPKSFQSNKLILHIRYIRLSPIADRVLYKGEYIEVPSVIFTLVPLLDQYGYIGEYYAWGIQDVIITVRCRLFLENQGGKIRDLNTKSYFYKARLRYLAEHLLPILQQFFALGPDSDASNSFIEQRQAEMQMVLDHAQKVMEWKKQQEEERANEIGRAKTDRRDMLVVS